MQTDEFLRLAHRDRRRAGEWLIAANGARIWRLAGQWLDRDAEDGVQEVYREILRSLPRFRGDASVTTWCYRIAMNTLIDLSKKRRRTPAPLPLEAVEADPPAAELGRETLARFAEDPFTRLGRDELRDRVRRGLADLDEMHRAVLTLRTFEGLSYAEIAGVLDIPLGTVKSRMAAATVKLAEKLQSCREDLS
jgi:RNA polymerase sigma-70 factor (ECF subfamily)